MNAPFKFLYFGSHGTSNDLGTILDGFALASSQLGPQASSLHLVGNGPLKSHLKKQAAQLGLTDLITFEDPIAKERIPALAESADALVLSLLPLRLYRFGISLNKLYEYLAAARPILFAGDPINNPVREADAGVCRDIPTKESIASGMVELVNSSMTQRARWGQNGFNHAQNEYSYRALGAKLNDHLRSLLTSNG